jgi:hypothetical protein
MDEIALAVVLKENQRRIAYLEFAQTSRLDS